MARKSPTDNPDGARSLRGNRSVDSKIVKGSKREPAASTRETTSRNEPMIFSFDGWFLIDPGRCIAFSSIYLPTERPADFLSPGSSSGSSNLIRIYLLPFQRRLTVKLIIPAILFHSFWVNPFPIVVAH